MSHVERNRHKLIQEMITRYLQRAWSDAEMAEALETDRTNVYKIRTKVLEKQMGIPMYKESHGRYRINREIFVANIRLKPAEALALYLGGRRLQQQTKTGQADVANALRKLSEALYQPLMQNLVQAAETVLDQEQDARQAEVMRNLIDCWINGRRVRIHHRKLHGNLRRYIVSPYQLEPATWGDGIYLIGHSDYHNGLAAFKVSRIERAVPTTEPFTVPDDFDSHDLLKYAWGIWYDDEETVTVRLQFKPFVTPRVKESIWHPEQVIRDTADGGCIWEAEIAHWQEMLPWVRGWGSDVTVLAPEKMRQALIHTTERLGEQYKVRPPSQRHPYQWLYAKTDRENPNHIHLLLYHLIDVGSVALIMWQKVFTKGICQKIATLLHTSIEEAGKFMAFIVSLHDLGKASPAYQKKYAPQWLKDKLNEVGFKLDDNRYSQKTADPQTPHATITTWALPTLLQVYCNLDIDFARDIGIALGGHHGIWPSSEATDGIDDTMISLWDEARHELIWELRNVFQPPDIKAPMKGMERNTFLTLLSGITSVADWLGSREDAFPLVNEVLTTRIYTRNSVQNAHKALQELGWIGWKANHSLLDFSTMFHYLDSQKPRIDPHLIQQEIINATVDLSTPSLAIIEAPTGIGKTEIAFYLADTLLQKHDGHGLYIAMPTQATSNQMFTRTKQFLAQRYATNQLVNLQLAHGQSAFDEQYQNIVLQVIDEEDEQQSGRVVAMSWFNEKSKRTLLAPFGVGTVDQTLLSVLQTKHFFVRLMGLSNKVVIFDEVHAYDTYMSTIFDRLLNWLQAIGTSVIILSATLPVEIRGRLVRAYTGQTSQLDNLYPALTLATPDQVPTIIQLTPPEDKVLQIEWLESFGILSYLKTILQQNEGCIAVICNTVGRAQALFRVLLEAYQGGELPLDPDNLILFHARFPPIWRKQIEKRVLQKFGKPQKQQDGPQIDYRPNRALIVATQVIEQSLDLDFDAMITDLAPIDLLIQRAGRLHRHKIRDARRKHPRCLTIIQPELGKNQVPIFGHDELIYDRYILLRTYQQVKQNDEWQLPRQTIELIESVYTPGRPTDKDVYLQEAFKMFRRERHDAYQKAKTQLILDADDPMLMRKMNIGLEEDNPAIHQTFQAKTRDIGPTIRLICLYATDRENWVQLESNAPDTAFNLAIPPSHNLVKELLQREINVQNWTLLKHFIEQEVPPTWKKHASLRHTRQIIFHEGKYHFHDYKNRPCTLSLCRKFGLQLTKYESEKEKTL